MRGGRTSICKHCTDTSSSRPERSHFTDKYQPIFDFFSDTFDDGKQDFWNSVAICNKDRTNYSKLRLNQKNDEFPESCLEENLNQNSDVSPEISSSKNMVFIEFINSSVQFFQYWMNLVILTYIFLGSFSTMLMILVEGTEVGGNMTLMSF